MKGEKHFTLKIWLSADLRKTGPPIFRKPEDRTFGPVFSRRTGPAVRSFAVLVRSRTGP